MFSSASVLKTNCCISKTDKPSFQRTSIWVWSTPRKSTEINQICFPWQQIHPWDFVNNYRIFNKQTGNYFTVWGREDHRYYYSNLSINSCITSFDYRVVPDRQQKKMPFLWLSPGIITSNSKRAVAPNMHWMYQAHSGNLVTASQKLVVKKKI